MAENQPGTTKNRMGFAKSFRPFVARLRDFMRLSTGGTPALAGDGLFNELALELFHLQYERNAVLRRWARAHGVGPASIRHWTQITAIPTAAFKETDMTVLPDSERSTVFLSSGTTLRNSSRHYHNADSLAVYEASLWPWFSTHLLPASAPALDLLVLTPSANEAPHSSLVHMFETIGRKHRPLRSLFAARAGQTGVWHLDLGLALRFLEESVGMGRPLLVLGTAFMFVHLVDGLAERKIQIALPDGTRVLETGGYKGRSRTLEKAELHRLISDYLGVPSSHIVCEYGMAELSSQGYDRVVGSPTRGFRFPPWARMQVVSPETGLEVEPGEPGLIRVFDLANIYSSLAVQTEDLAIRSAEGCELIGRAPETEARGCSLLAV